MSENLKELDKQIDTLLVKTNKMTSIRTNIVNEHSYQWATGNIPALQIDYYDCFQIGFSVTVYVVQLSNGKLQMHYDCGHSSHQELFEMILTIALHIENRRVQTIYNKD